MNQANFLQVSDETHCLRCHQTVMRDDFIAHVGENGTCPKIKEEAKLDYKGCAKCKTFEGKFGWLDDKYGDV